MLNTKIQVVDNLPNILLNGNFEIDQRFAETLAN